MLLLFPCLAGCAYFHDRGRDACDMVTLAVEAPAANVSAQIGTMACGVGVAGGKGFGLRSGALGQYKFGELNLGLVSIKELSPDGKDEDRGKGYESAYWIWPFSDPPKGGVIFDTSGEGKKKLNAAQIEAMVGLGVGVRVGVNLAEITDFILGWTTIDICDDDLSTMAKKVQQRTQKAKAMGMTIPEVDPPVP